MKNFLIFLIFVSILSFPIYGKDLKHQNIHVQAQSLLAVEKCTYKKHGFKFFLKKIIVAPKYSGYVLRLFLNHRGEVNW